MEAPQKRALLLLNTCVFLATSTLAAPVYPSDDWESWDGDEENAVHDSGDTTKHADQNEDVDGNDVDETWMKNKQEFDESEQETESTPSVSKGDVEDAVDDNDDENKFFELDPSITQDANDIQKNTEISPSQEASIEMQGDDSQGTSKQEPKPVNSKPAKGSHYNPIKIPEMGDDNQDETLDDDDDNDYLPEGGIDLEQDMDTEPDMDIPLPIEHSQVTPKNNPENSNAENPGTSTNVHGTNAAQGGVHTSLQELPSSADDALTSLNFTNIIILCVVVIFFLRLPKVKAYFRSKGVSDKSSLPHFRHDADTSEYRSYKAVSATAKSA